MCIAVLRGKQRYGVLEARLVAQFQVKCHPQVGPQAMFTLTFYSKSHFKQTIDVVHINMIPQKKAYYYFLVYLLGFS